MVARRSRWGDPGDLAALGVRPAEDARRRQAADHVVEVMGEGGEGEPAPPGLAPGRPPDQRAEQRDERQRAQHGDSGHGVGDGDRDQHRQRDRDRSDERGQVTGEVAVEPVEPGSRQLSQRRGVPAAAVVGGPGVAPPPGTERDDAGEQRGAQFGLGLGGGPVRGGLRRPRDRRPADGDGGERGQRYRARIQRRLIDKYTRDHGGEQPRLRDHQHGRRQAERRRRAAIGMTARRACRSSLRSSGFTGSAASAEGPEPGKNARGEQPNSAGTKKEMIGDSNAKLTPRYARHVHPIVLP